MGWAILVKPVLISSEINTGTGAVVQCAALLEGPSLMVCLGMDSKIPPPRKTPYVIAQEAIRRYEVIERAIRQNHYQINEMEAALGMYALGFHYGWKVLYVVHSRQTIAKYEGLLGIKIRAEFPEFGLDADRTNAYKMIKAVTNFWRLVSGDTKPPLDIDRRTIL